MVFDPKSVQDIELKKFKNNPIAVELYREAKRLLVESGIINFLRIFSRPLSRDMGANVYTAAYTAAFTEGYAKCLDDLVYFDEMYLEEAIRGKDIRPDFGAISLARGRNDLTDKDVEILNAKRKH